MSTFNLPGTDVLVKLTDDLSKDEVLDFPAFKNWISTLQSNFDLQKDPKHVYHKSPYILRSINIQAIDRFGKGIGFMKIAATITNSEDESLPGAIFLRGASVGMLVILQPEDIPSSSQEDKHVILTVQSRVATGGLQFVELPAGMVDDGSFSGAAAKEIKEELGLEIPEHELVNLSELAIPDGNDGEEKSPRAMFPSAGGCDEYVPIFLHERRVPRGQLKEWTGKLTGLRSEGEKITLKLVKLEDLWLEGARDSKALAACAIYEGLKRTGKL
ncbi:related to nucleoside diphosphate-sugar hydrolase of the MutT (NUDIX) family [Rhynchosporium secalis]|uniref:Related to nucleoside diphosphate-sugar hydrolase of the MutT (NUDIX) family n=1 Tax=Rhynchosporium secalis TaxID=38038 RepID=A0A1E1MHT4_RHYSE|nr:related to nucleoside diphosphate-sugar hydrolase of the MutT (NUDIX) family [Rhynchosporium secalis]